MALKFTELSIFIICGIINRHQKRLGYLMSNTTKSLIKSTMILGVAGVIVKIIGAFFRIALTNLIHFEGMSYYQQAFPGHSALLSISAAVSYTHLDVYKRQVFLAESTGKSAQGGSRLFKAKAAYRRGKSVYPCHEGGYRQFRPFLIFKICSILHFSRKET